MKTNVFVLIIIILFRPLLFLGGNEESPVVDMSDYLENRLGSAATLEEKIGVVINYDAMQTDFGSPAIERLRNEVFESGKEAFPILVQTLKNTEETSVATSVIANIYRLELENNKPVKRLYKRIFSGKLRVPNQNYQTMVIMASSVKRFGDSSYADMLLSVLEIEDIEIHRLAVPANALFSLGKIGDRSTIIKIEKSMKKYSRSISREEIESSEVLRYARDAIAEIESRYPDAAIAESGS